MWVVQATGRGLGGLGWRLQLINTDKPEKHGRKWATPLALLFTLLAVAETVRGKT